MAEPQTRLHVRVGDSQRAALTFWAERLIARGDVPRGRFFRPNGKIKLGTVLKAAAHYTTKETQ